MKIAMFTNTYLPHVGGVARSVKTLEDELRKMGHEVKVIAPEADGAPPSEHVLRVPAIQRFNGSDFSVRIPAPNLIRDFIAAFGPDIIHSHHPFLLGDAAVRESWKMDVPLVFTHHTLYERYTHYVPLDSEALKRIAIQLATEYCNLCEHVIAPSESVAHLLESRGVESGVTAVPTGIDTSAFSAADGKKARAIHGIPAEAVVIGHVGRIAEEKNLGYLAEALGGVLKGNREAWFLLVGDGPGKQDVIDKTGPDRVAATGSLHGGDLEAAYRAMDVFVFSSQSETQGMVLAEAMAAGVPVVALDGPGVRDIVRDGENGILLPADAEVAEFGKAVEKVVNDRNLREKLAGNASATAQDFDRKLTTARVASVYQDLIAEGGSERAENLDPWDRLLSAIGGEWELTAAKLSAIAAVMAETRATEATLD